MIYAGSGNLLESEAEALVNTVNTVGVMGKGIALQFRNAYPDNFRAYAAACRRGEVVTGKMFVHESAHLDRPARLIINFPTKRHWKNKSQLEYIKSGLEDLARTLIEYKVKSVAIPPLGCGNGGLDWREVEPLIRSTLEAVPAITVYLHAPDGAPSNDTMPIATKFPDLTIPRAVMIAAMGNYLLPEYKLTAIEAQKLAYFLQVSGVPLRLNYVKAQFGPYADSLNHALQALEGHYLRGYGDRNTAMAIYLLPEAMEKAYSHLQNDGLALNAVATVERIVRGFETSYGLELLATTHWAMVELDTEEISPVVQYVQAWTERKASLFTKEHISLAIARLLEVGLPRSVDSYY